MSGEGIERRRPGLSQDTLGSLCVSSVGAGKGSPAALTGLSAAWLLRWDPKVPEWPPCSSGACGNRAEAAGIGRFVFCTSEAWRFPQSMLSCSGMPQVIGYGVDPYPQGAHNRGGTAVMPDRFRRHRSHLTRFVALLAHHESRDEPTSGGSRPLRPGGPVVAPSSMAMPERPSARRHVEPSWLAQMVATRRLVPCPDHRNYPISMRLNGGRLGPRQVLSC